MNKTSIQPVGMVLAADPIVPSKTRTSVRDGSPEPVPGGQEKTARPAESAEGRPGSLSNISIHFDVNDETNQLVVIVVDRASGHVIRAIPASELEKLQAGELLKWTA